MTERAKMMVTSILCFSYNVSNDFLSLEASKVLTVWYRLNDWLMVWCLMLYQTTTILDWIKLKAIADDKIYAK